MKTTTRWLASRFLVRLLPFLTLACVAAESKVTGTIPEHPNIVLIMTDDQGYGDLGVTGNPLVDTPSIDAFAAGAASLETFYVSPVCSPTRACLMTGRYNYRTRVIDTYKGRSMMDPSEVTIAEVLAEAGYATGIFGKWHLGDCYPMRPIDQGFEEALVLRGGGLAQPSEPIESRRRYTNPILIHNGTEILTEGYCTDVYFTAARQFMAKAADEGRPFFVYIAPNAPHGPFHDVPEKLYAKYRAKDLTPVLEGRPQDADTVARVFAMVENIDENVGTLMEDLEARGWMENTLVIFMVDNGPNTRRYVGEMRGMKSEVYDGGIRSPFYVHWPARLKPGTSSDRIAAHIDVMPTLLEAANVELPSDLQLDGRSLLPLLEGQELAWPDRTLVLQTHRGDEPLPFHHMAIRSQRWKLVHATGFGRETPPTDVPFQLFDMSKDGKEGLNVAAENPEVVAQLRAAYERWFQDVSHTRPNNFAAPRIWVGSDREPRTVLTWQDWRVINPGGWGRQGKWFLRFLQPATYDVECLWPEPVTTGRAELSVGHLSRQVDLTEGATRVVFEDVEIPPGDAELMVAVHQGDEVKGPYQVVLLRKTPETPVP